MTNNTIQGTTQKLDEKNKNSTCAEEKETDEAQAIDIIEMDELFSYIKEKKTEFT